MEEPAPSLATDVADSILAGAPYRIGAVTLVVNDLGALARFYQDVIGLDAVSGEPGTVRLGAGDTVLLVLRGIRMPDSGYPRRRGCFIPRSCCPAAPT